MVPRLNRQAMFAAKFLAACALLLGAGLYAHGQYAGHLTVDFLDVGQGDAILITTPAQQHILIDGGPDRSVEAKVGANMPFFDRTIDLIILSHAHADQVNGLVEIMKHYKVRRVVMSGVKHDASGYRAFLEEIARQKIPVEIVYGGKDIEFEGGVFFHVLAPLQDSEGKSFKELHESTVVARMSYGSTDFLFTGDINTQIEEEILAHHEELSSEVLKVSHHGSRYSTSKEFLEAVDPDIAIIEVGKDNKYSHPHPELLKRLQEYGLKVYRTDQNGDVRITSDGNALNIQD